jgi:hypothetical protein
VVANHRATRPVRSGSRPPGRVSRLLGPHRCAGIAFGHSPTEKPGYGVLWVAYVIFYPLEQSNAQLTSLIENFLNLIDRGFGEGSLDPLRQASEMAANMLKTEITPINDSLLEQDSIRNSEAAIDVTGEMVSETNAIISYAEPEMVILDEIKESVADDCEIETVGEVEEDVQVIQDIE